MTYEEMTQCIESGRAYFNRSYPGGAWMVGGIPFNRQGQQLRHAKSYDPDEDGCYTPFGDE